MVSGGSNLHSRTMWIQITSPKFMCQNYLFWHKAFRNKIRLICLSEGKLFYGRPSRLKFLWKLLKAKKPNIGMLTKHALTFHGIDKILQEIHCASILIHIWTEKSGKKVLKFQNTHLKKFNAILINTSSILFLINKSLCLVFQFFFS